MLSLWEESYTFGLEQSGNKNSINPPTTKKKRLRFCLGQLQLGLGTDDLSGAKDSQSNTQRKMDSAARNGPRIISLAQEPEERERPNISGRWKMSERDTISLLIHKGWPGSACDKTQVINIPLSWWWLGLRATPPPPPLLPFSTRWYVGCIFCFSPTGTVWL